MTTLQDTGVLSRTATMTDPRARVTIVMTARERHSLTLGAIKSIVANTRPPYRLLYANCDAPAWLQDALAANGPAWNVEVVRFDEPLWPQEARARLADAIATPYTVFIDNDVDVGAGWLDALVTCADETGAGVVGPLYLLGDGVQPALIHMAGGRLVETLLSQGRVLDERHTLANSDPRDVADSLRRERCDFVEYHCMLVRTDLLRAGILDPRIRCVHEHIDTSLSARKLGYETYCEPTARVTYLGGADYMLDDMAFLRARWKRADVDASIAAFSHKWNVVDDERSFGCVRVFAGHHVAQADPIRPALRDRPEHEAEMAATELCQTRSALLDLACSRGYSPNEIATIAQAYGLAHTLMDGGYRPCGRPFINHATGTASVLVRYGFRAEVVAAGLLHAAYTHCPVDAAGIGAAVEGVCRALGGRDSAIERRVRAYTLRDALLAHADSRADSSTAAPPTLSVSEAEVIAIVAANELDMHMSGEIRYSGRTDVIAPAVVTQIVRVCAALGVPGLPRSLLREQAREAPAPRECRTGLRESYRIGPDRRSPMPMATNVPAVLP
jgi:GT2 family glycosyltransferase